LLGNRGVDSWQAIKWIPRFILFAVCIVLILYIFSALLSLDYDADSLRARSFANMIILSDVFASEDQPGVIMLDRFGDGTLESLFLAYSTETSADVGDEPLVEELVFAPAAARLRLVGFDDSFEEREAFYEKETFETLRELYVGGGESVRYQRSVHFVRVVDPEDAFVVIPARLEIEVVV
jgi:hypothetical protein